MAGLPVYSSAFSLALVDEGAPATPTLPLLWWADLINDPGVPQPSLHQ